MKFFIHRCGGVLSEYSFGKDIPVMAARDEINWYYIRLDTWPDLVMSSPCMLINNSMRDKFVLRGDWIEISLPEYVTIT